MSSLVHQRCWHHADREAVARCPECRRFYCRECSTEHRGRMMCAGCVARLAGDPGTARRRFGGILWSASTAGGLLLAWLIFYYLGVMLARIPSEFFGGPA